MAAPTNAARVKKVLANSEPMVWTPPTRPGRMSDTWTAARRNDAACAQIQDNNLSDLVREMIAARIVEAAKRGERDPVRLCSIAIAALGSDRENG